MNLTFEHSNVPQETLEGITGALIEMNPFALKSPTGVLKFFDVSTLQSWHHDSTMQYKSSKEFNDDLSMSLYRFKEFVSFQQIKLLPHAPKQITDK